MIANCEVSIISATVSTNGFGDVTYADGAPTVVPGHIGGLGGASASETDNLQPDGSYSSRCRIRISSSITVTETTVFEVKGIRWKPLKKRISRAPQNHATYLCERME